MIRSHRKETVRPHHLYEAFFILAVVVSSLLHHSVGCNAYQTPNPQHTGRRAFLNTVGDRLATTTIATILGSDALVSNAYAATPQYIGSTVMIQNYPELQYLVPIYTFQQSLEILSALLDPDLLARSQNPKLALSRASRLVDNFLRGGLLSNKNIFRGVCTIYIQEIKYDDPDRSKITSDRSKRLGYCDASLDGFNKLQKPLQQLVETGANSPTDEVLMYLGQSKRAIQDFANMIPVEDIERVKAWVEVISKADIDHDGKLEGQELEGLQEEDRKLYKAVGDFLG